MPTTAPALGPEEPTCQHLFLLPSLWGLLSPQLWSGPRRPPPGPRAAQPQPDCGDLPASQHGGLSHEDGTSEQPPGVFRAGPSISLYMCTHPRGGAWWKGLGPGLCWQSAVSVELCSWSQICPGGLTRRDTWVWLQGKACKGICSCIGHRAWALPGASGGAKHQGLTQGPLFPGGCEEQH